MREAAKIAEAGYQRMLEIARPGLPEFALAAEAEAFMRALGAEDNFQLLSASQHNKAAHRPSNRLLERGDILLGEITPAVEGEYVQICRTAVLGQRRRSNKRSSPCSTARCVRRCGRRGPARGRAISWT